MLPLFCSHCLNKSGNIKTLTFPCAVFRGQVWVWIFIVQGVKYFKAYLQEISYRQSEFIFPVDAVTSVSEHYGMF